MVKADFDSFRFETEYFPNLNISNSLVYLTIWFRRYGSYFQMTSNRPIAVLSN